MASHTYEDIAEGSRAQQTYIISDAVFEGFVGASGDTSPLHMSDEYARAQGFPARVMHGTILNGFISHFVGVHFPGERALLQSVNIQFKSPNFLGDSVELTATVSQKIDAVRVVVMDVRIQNLTRDKLAAVAKVQVGVR